MGIRNKFVKKFGEEEAQTMEAAAEEHKNRAHGKKGSDPFKWAILICIGYQCFEKDSYREHHGFKVPYKEIKRWVKRSADLSSHDGDFDYLAAMAGAYNEYIKSNKPEAAHDPT